MGLHRDNGTDQRWKDKPDARFAYQALANFWE